MNLLNSPGGQLLQMLGVHFPGAQHAPTAAQPDPGAFADYDFGEMPQPVITSAGLQAGLQLPGSQDIPKPPHGGLFSRLAQFLAGGA